jgi:hypothetical protein
MFQPIRKRLTLTTIVALTLILGQAPIATATSSAAAQANKPFCYMEKGGTQHNLDALCGIKTANRSGKPIDLTIDQNHDGIPDQLLSAVQDNKNRLLRARSPQEYAAIEQDLESRLPYTDRVHQMLAQARTFEKQATNAMSNGTYEQYHQLMTLSRKIQSQVENDPNYKTVQVAMGKVLKRLGQA